MYTAISLFSGVGGIDLAFAEQGFDIVAQVEIDPFCQKVLKKHAAQYWPNAVLYTDVKDVGKHNLPSNPAIVFGGFPCQDISNAGQGKGIKEGTRSGLWFEFARIIGEIRPHLVFLENVAAITSRDGTRVLADLTALGYDAEWCVVPASAVGAPHERKRWWCVAYPSGWGSGAWRTECQGQERIASPIQSGALADANALGDGPRRPCERGQQRIPETIGASPLAHSDGTRQLQPSGAFTGVGDRSEYSGKGMGNPATQRLSQCGQSELAALEAQEQTGLVLQSERPSKELVNANGERQQEQCGDFAAKSPLSSTQRSSDLSNANGESSVRTPVERQERSRGPVESGLGRAVLTGLSSWLDRSRFDRWAAPPNQAQYWYEPPRTAKGIRNRVARLKADGNGVCLPLVRVFAATLREALETGFGL